MPSTIDYEVRDRIADIRFNRPKVLNAIDPTMMRELGAALTEADDDDGVSVIVLSGRGRAFGTGYDLKYDWSREKRGEGPMAYRDYLGRLVAFEVRPWDCAKPVIAMVHGPCLAGSCEIAMMCCLTFAADDATFGEPEIRFSASAPALIMPWIIGLKKTRELLYSGDSIDAEAALARGMVNRVVPGDQLEAETFAYARKLTMIAPEALRATKAAINRTAEIMGLRQALAHANEINAALYATDTEVHQRFIEIRDAEGLGAALRWREAQFE